MSDVKKHSRMPELGEAAFCVIYLVFAFASGIWMLTRVGEKPIALLWALLTLVLCGGDSFHLVPRVIKALRGDSDRVQWWSGLGLMVSSITMTIFYEILMIIWQKTFPELKISALLQTMVWVSALLRIILCLFPQNNWFQKEGNLRWGIYRNLPFAVTGLCLVILYALSGNAGGYGLWKMSIAIVISFACYFPVVLWAKKKPMVGMLMMPKTIAYMWMICMGIGLCR